MTTVDEQQIKIAEGRDAQALKSNPALEACMKATLDDLFLRWVATGPDDGNERMAIWSTAQALRSFNDMVDAFISTGKIEESIRNEQLSKN